MRGWRSWRWWEEGFEPCGSVWEAGGEEGSYEVFVALLMWKERRERSSEGDGGGE